MAGKTSTNLQPQLKDQQVDNSRYTSLVNNKKKDCTLVLWTVASYKETSG